MGKRKIKKLEEILKKLTSVVVAYSGGVDSTFLLKAALEALGRDNVLAVTAKSELFPQSELKEAKEIARRLGVNHTIITTHELKNKDFAHNPVNRCYHCKKELFSKLKQVAAKERLNHVVDGTNFDDLKDVRYGRIAAAELGIASPLVEAGLGKKDIRTMSRRDNLPTWDKGTFACLASRFPHNQKISKRALAKIEDLEDLLKSLGFRQVRVRVHGKMARIEVGTDEVARFLNKKMRNRILRRFSSFGFVHVALDLAGYRTGSMNPPS